MADCPALLSEVASGACGLRGSFRSMRCQRALLRFPCSFSIRCNLHGGPSLPVRNPFDHVAVRITGSSLLASSTSRRTTEHFHVVPIQAVFCCGGSLAGVGESPLLPLPICFLLKRNCPIALDMNGHLRQREGRRSLNHTATL